MKRLLAALFVLACFSTTAALAFQRRDCESTLPTRLIRHERGRISLEDPQPQNVREGANTTFDLVGQIPAGGIFYVLEGPVCSPLYAWYRVEYRAADGELLTGWIAEGSSDSYFVETYPPGE